MNFNWACQQLVNGRAVKLKDWTHRSLVQRDDKLCYGGDHSISPSTLDLLEFSRSNDFELADVKVYVRVGDKIKLRGSTYIAVAILDEMCLINIESGLLWSLPAKRDSAENRLCLNTMLNSEPIENVTYVKGV